MLENYLNKNVAIEEKLFHLPSAISEKTKNEMPHAVKVNQVNTIEGIITDFDENYIELDNKMLIARKFIYRITLK